MPNTFVPPGIEPGPFGILTDDATHLAIQPRNVAMDKIAELADEKKTYYHRRFVGH